MLECFVCSSSASTQYKLKVETEVFNDKPLCEACASNFNKVDRVEVINQDITTDEAT